MTNILVLPGDGIGPSIISSAVEVLELMDSATEFTYGDIGFDAYEKSGYHLPTETLDLAIESENILCGPVRIAPDARGSDARPMSSLMVQLDLYAMVRCFNTLSKDLGVEDMAVTMWGSNTAAGKDVVETRDIDGITLTKYVKSASYSRMMARALSDLEISGKQNVACLTRNDLFPESSGMFEDLFKSLFQEDVYNRELLNVCRWSAMVTREPLKHDYLICADLYSNVVAGVLAGMTGGNHLAPIGYVGDNHLLITPGTMETFDEMPPEYANPTSAIIGSAMIMFNQNRRSEAEDILAAVKQAYDDGERTPDVGGELTTKEFTSRVISHI